VGQRRVRLLDLDKIIDAATELVVETGRFTMPGLASRLGVSVSSIYHHVPGRAALVEHIRARASAPMRETRLDVDDWAAAVAGWLANCRETFARRPELVALLAGSGTPSLERGHEQLERALSNGGFPAAEVPMWISAVDSYGIGAAVKLAAELDVRAEVAQARAGGRSSSDQAFELGVRAILDGMRAALDRPSR
jgi:AcrR family transcriptional regulator